MAPGKDIAGRVMKVLIYYMGLWINLIVKVEGFKIIMDVIEEEIIKDLKNLEL